MIEVKATADQARIPEEFPDLLEVGIGSDVKIHRGFPQNKVAHSTSYEIRGETVVFQAMQDFQGIRIDEGS
jgi:hypothetical protein